jgi:hypothetical protein
LPESALGDLLDCSNWPSRLTGPERLDRRIDRTRQLYQRFHKTMAASLFSNFMRYLDRRGERDRSQSEWWIRDHPPRELEALAAMLGDPP